MDLLIVSGMSGSGKSSAIKILEDMGFYCVDNFPIDLYESLPKLIKKSNLNNKIAITLDVRNRQSFSMINDMFKFLEDNDIIYSMLFIDTDSEKLLLRYKETRRRHPLMDSDKNLEFAIEMERFLLEDIRGVADYLLDTSDMLIMDLREHLFSLFGESMNTDLIISFVSFGFKYGLLADADLVFDLRALKNPYYISDLRAKTGNDQEVFDYVLANSDAQTLYKHIYDYLEFSVPLYIREGKSQLVVGLACTGGQHRSVTFANKLYDDFNLDGVRKLKNHRDIKK